MVEFMVEFDDVIMVVMAGMVIWDGGKGGEGGEGTWRQGEW